MALTANDEFKKDRTRLCFHHATMLIIYRRTFYFRSIFPPLVVDSFPLLDFYQVISVPST